MKTDTTHEAQRTSWIETANADSSPFPIQNLPYCRFLNAMGQPTIGVGIGDQVVDLRLASPRLDLPDEIRSALQATALNPVMALPKAQRKALRHAISDILTEDNAALRDDATLREHAVVAQSTARFMIAAEVGDYTDFYASVFHATNVGSMFRPDNPLLPNYKWIPIGYHGRASSLIVSGEQVQRPMGQTAPVEPGQAPGFGPSTQLDYELELAIWVGQGNPLGTPVSIDDAEEHIFGVSLLNDWSARDLQRWEYQPLGPFLAKSFATTVSPWVVTWESLVPFRCAAFQRPEGDPQPLSHLDGTANRKSGGLDLTMEVFLRSEKMRNANQEAQQLSQSSYRDVYWTPAQMLTHHTSNGCNLSPGDIMASGTVSGPGRDARGCLLELTWDGDLDNIVPGSQRTPIELPDGSHRKFLEDGDELTLAGYCERDGFRRIGLGDCRGVVSPAKLR